MIIFLYGPDDYRREEKKREIVAEFKKKRSDLGIGKFSLEDESGFDKFSDFLKNQSLFQAAKMAVLTNSFEVEGGRLKGESKNELKAVIDNKNITVLISEKDKPLKAMDFLLKKPVLVQEFEILKGKEWEDFAKSEIKKRSINISDSGFKFLVQVYEGNTWGLITELDKVQFLGTEEIGVRELENIGVAQAPNFWSLIWGFKNRDIKQRLWALEKVFGMNEPGAKIFNILAYQLPEKIGDMARYDLMVKSGKLEYEEALVDLVIN